MKVSKSKNEEIIKIVCPVCTITTEAEKITRIFIAGEETRLYDEVGKIYQCGNPECGEYLEKIDDEFRLIKKTELIERQTKITDYLAKEAELARARLIPAVVEAEIIKAEAGRALSPLLFHLTADRPPVHRAYSVTEVLDACRAIGFNPLEVGSRRIGFVLNWLKEYKD